MSNNLVGRYAAIAALLFIFAPTSGCSPCSEEAISKVPSPKGAYTAVITERNCGTTTDYVREVSLRENKMLVFSTSTLVTRTSGLGLSHVRWIDAHTLEVRYDKSYTRFFEQNQAVDAVNIVYRPVE